MSSGIEEVGYVQWDLLGYLILAWTVVYCVIWKGLHNSGKVRLTYNLYCAKQGTRNVRASGKCTQLYMFHKFNALRLAYLSSKVACLKNTGG